MAKAMKATIEIGGKLDKSLVNAMSAAEKQMRLLEKSAGSIKKVAASAAKAAGVAVAAAGAGVAKAVKDSIEAGKGFDSSMSQVAATMGKTTDQLNSEVVSVGDFTGTLRDFAQEMGAKTAFSASEAADALNYMALAGYDAEKSVGMLPTVLNLAAAGGIDLAYASDMVTDASSALGLSTEETAAMVDKMAKASSKSNTSVQQLGEAMLVVGGTAKNLAGGTTELSTALGVLANNGIKGTEGGTHLRNLLLSLQSPTDDAAAYLEELGVSVFDADGRLRSLGDVFAELNGQMSQMTDEQKVGVLSTLFNKTDLSAAQAMLAGTASSVEDLKISLRAMGVAGEDAALTSFTLQGGFEEVAAAAREGADASALAQQMVDGYGLSAETAATVSEQLAAAVGGEASDFGKLFADIEAGWYTVDGLSKSLSDAGLDLDEMRSSLEVAGVTAEEFEAALGKSSGNADEFADMLLDAADAGVGFDRIADALGGDLDKLGRAFAGTTGAAQAMADTQLDNLEGDITIFNSALEGTQIAISDALTPTLREFVQYGTQGLGELTETLKSDGFKDWAAGVASDVTGALRGAVEALADFKDGFEEGFDADGFASALSGVGAAIGGAFGDGSDAPAAKNFGGILAGGLNMAADVIRMATPLVRDVAGAVRFLADNAGVLLPALGGAAAAMGALKAGMAISGVIQAFTTALGASAAATDAMAASQGLLNAVMNANPIVLVVSIIGGLVTALVLAYNTSEDFRNAVDGAFGAVGEVVGSVIGGIGALLGDLGAWLEGAAGAVADFAAGAGELFGGLADDAGAAFGEIAGAVSEDMAAAQRAGGAAADALGAALAGDWDAAAAKTVEAYGAIQGAIADKLTAAGEVAGNVADAIGDALGFPGLGDSVRGVFEAVKNAMTDPIGAARDAIGKIIDAIKGFFSGFHVELPKIKLPHFAVKPEGWQIGDLLQGKIPTLDIQWYARGGFTDGPVAIAGEAGTEAVISFDRRYRSENVSYWIAAGQMLGMLTPFAEGGFTDGRASALSVAMTSPGSALSEAAASTTTYNSSQGGTVNLGGVTFAPRITVSGQGEQDIVTQLRAAESDFRDLLEDIMAEKEAEYGWVL